MPNKHSKKVQNAQGTATYANKIKTMFGSALVAFWPMNELTGTTAVNTKTAAATGTYNSVTLANAAGPKGGKLAPLFNGTGSDLNVYSTALNAVFNGAAGAIFGWSKVSAAAVWSDATVRYMMYLQVNSSNNVLVYRNTTNGRVTAGYRAGGAVALAQNVNSLSTTDWMFWVVNFSQAEFSVYYNAAQQGTNQTTAGAWSGSLGATVCNIGSGSSTPANVWSGWLADWGILAGRVMTQAEITKAYTMK